MRKDLTLHCSVCFAVAAVTAFVAAMAVGGYVFSALCGFAVAMAMGVGKEYGDHCAKGNHWDWLDIAADALGALSGGALGAVGVII